MSDAYEQMNTKPILFNGEMVRAIIDGRKTMTRRVIKPQPTRMEDWRRRASVLSDGELKYGKAGEGLLWVRETWRELGSVQQEDGTIPEGIGRDQIVYRADEQVDPGPWRPSIFLPRTLSRLTLRVSNVRVERLQNITPEDVRAEGILLTADESMSANSASKYRPKFRYLWDSINAKRGYLWESNPWCWVIEWDKVWTQNVDDTRVRMDAGENTGEVANG